MRNFYVITHGAMANGLAETIKMLIGDKKSITPITAYIGNQLLEDLVLDVIRDIESGVEVIVFTDIAHGSVNQYFVPYLKYANFHLITGINIAIVLSIMLLDSDEPISRESILREVEFSREQIIYMNTHIIKIDDADEL
ncbi:MAG: hypothetical protein BGO41_12420 [Clostridiales bacterium 38-18]|nr:MAG: hypothetical protein BGO41_12420 [Clostridiales bacterium 38-18]